MLTDPRLDPIESLPAQDSVMGSGVFLLTGAYERTGPSSQRYLQLTLEDATGRVTGYVWPEARPTVRCPALPSPVLVRATVQLREHGPQLNVQSLATLSTGEVALATALLPRRRCPAEAWPALARLARLERELPEPLRGFLREVLLDPEITLPFLSCRASVSHHHAHPGGLLVHSTEMLDLAAEEARIAIPEDEWAPYLCQLGYLLHDLGKLRSVGTGRRPLYPLVVQHELLTIELLGPHLHWLELHNLALASGLRHVFGYLATPAKARKPAEYAIAEIVENLDQLSAANFNARDLNHLLHERPQTAPRSGQVVRFPDGQPADPEARHA